MRSQRTLKLAIGLIAAILSNPGCREPASAPAAQRLPIETGAPATPALPTPSDTSPLLHRKVVSVGTIQAEARTPSEVVLLLQRLHREGAYSRLAEHLAEECREPVTDFLLAVGDVVAANQRLSDAVRRRAFESLPPGVDLSVIAENLGPFSRAVTVIREDRFGESASVTIQEGRHVPLVRLNFERRGGTWRYRAAVPSSETIHNLRELARIVGDVAGSVERGLSGIELADAIEYRILPQAGRVQRAAFDEALTPARRPS